MILLAGLGNPGSEYARTRHNAGAMAVDEIVRRYCFSSYREKFKGLLAEGEIARERVLVLKPQTYMNLSGEALQAALSFYKIPLQRVFVFHDDMDLKPWQVKVKTGGGSGGHNGLKSIDAHVGSDYARVRIGIGKPALKEQVVSFVLSSFDKPEIWRSFFEELADHVPALIEGRADVLMNKMADFYKETTDGI